MLNGMKIRLRARTVGLRSAEEEIREQLKVIEASASLEICLMDHGCDSGATPELRHSCRWTADVSRLRSKIVCSRRVINRNIA